ncbi:MAG: glycosyltransferase family 2 protein [Lachnospiraceae bacterium]|nr:glycosyltransferase family 2 protein [Lachnospiraceae bacterium]
MEYAAIIIPTLNRYKHLKRCVESIKENKEAKYTDLYISVDFPPSDKYRDGYEEVKEYVTTIEGFATLNIYYQEKNLGPGLNRKFLEEKISVNHDKYVFTDDDNEFSNNFLSYVNWGLEKFKDDEDIYAICSTSDFEIKVKEADGDYMVLPAYNPYGTGHWLHKNRKCAAYLAQDIMRPIYKSKHLQDKLLYYSPMIYMCVASDTLRKEPAMRGKDDQLTYIDINENIYCILNDKKCVIPTKIKSRNWGLDGSGVHSHGGQNSDYQPSAKLDAEEWGISPIRLTVENEELNRISHKDKFAISQKDKRKGKILYKINAVFGNKIVLKFYKFLRKIYRIIKGKPLKDKQEVMYG